MYSFIMNRKYFNQIVYEVSMLKVSMKYQLLSFIIAK